MTNYQRLFVITREKSKMAESNEGPNIMEHPNEEKKGPAASNEKPGRMKCFSELFKRCLDVIMSTGSPAQFKKYFHEIRAQNPAAFSSITEQLMNHLRRSIEAEINLMVNQEELEKFFNTLDQIVADSKTETQQAWRPTGNPSDDCVDHLMPVKYAYRDKMKALLEKIEKENSELENIVLPRRTKIEEKQEEISLKANHLKEAADYCQELDLTILKNQMKSFTNSV